MKRNRKLIICSALFLLASCSTTTTFNKKPPQNAPSADADIKLAEAAGVVSSSLIELAQIEKEARPRMRKVLINADSYNLQARASVDWSGPIEELLLRLANATSYRLRVLGKKPAIPVLVSITSHDEVIADILRNIDYLAANKADLRVYPKQNIIELRYAKA